MGWVCIAAVPMGFAIYGCLGCLADKTTQIHVLVERQSMGFLWPDVYNRNDNHHLASRKAREPDVFWDAHARLFMPRYILFKPDFAGLGR